MGNVPGPTEDILYMGGSCTAAWYCCKVEGEGEGEGEGGNEGGDTEKDPESVKVLELEGVLCAGVIG
jgi:hypothetical protein